MRSIIMASTQMHMENVTDRNIQLIAENFINLTNKLDEAIPAADKSLAYEVKVNYLIEKVQFLEKDFEKFPLGQSENHPKMSRLVRGGFSKKYAAAVSICSVFLVVYEVATPGPEIAKAHFLNNLHQVTPLFCPLFWWYMRWQLLSRKWPERISYIVSVKFGTFCPKAEAGQRATL